MEACLLNYCDSRICHEGNETFTSCHQKSICCTWPAVIIRVVGGFIRLDMHM